MAIGGVIMKAKRATEGHIKAPEENKWKRMMMSSLLPCECPLKYLCFIKLTEEGTLELITLSTSCTGIGKKQKVSTRIL